LKFAHHLSIKQISKRLKISQYQLNKFLLSSRSTKARRLEKTKRPERFSKFSKRIVKELIDFLLDARSIRRIGEIHKFLHQKLKLRVSKNHLRAFLKEKLGMSYKLLGIISTRHNKRENMLMR
jgi:transposase